MSEPRGNYRIAAAVLAGGSSTRMGRPKENMIIKNDGRTFLDKMCDEVNACYGKSISGRYISVRKEQKISREGYTVIEDGYDGIGPLGGLISVLRQARAEGMDAVLMLAVDMILYNKKEIEGICSAYEGEDILFARTEGKRIQPLASVYSTGMIDRAVMQAETGNYRLLSLLEAEGVLYGYFDASSAAFYCNVNSPGDIGEADLLFHNRTDTANCKII